MKGFLSIFKKLSFSFFVFFLAFSAYAQEPLLEEIQISQIDDSSLILTHSPSVVSVGNTVSLKLKSYSNDLNNFTIAWLVNDIQIKEGRGKTSFSFTITTSNPTITVVVSKDENIQAQKTLFLTTDTLDLLYEARNSYAPAFYKGRTLPVRESAITVVALPSDNSQNYSYSWEKDFSNQGSQNGYEKNAFSYSNSLLKKEEIISVEGYTNSGKRIKGQISIPALEKPSLLFYQKREDGFDYSKNIKDSFTIFGKSATLIAEPYFIGKKNILDQDISYMWKINKQEQNTPETKNILTLSPQGEGGRGILGIHIQNTRKLFQEVSETLSIDILES